MACVCARVLARACVPVGDRGAAEAATGTVAVAVVAAGAAACTVAAVAAVGAAAQRADGSNGWVEIQPCSRSAAWTRYDYKCVFPIWSL